MLCGTTIGLDNKEMCGEEVRTSPLEFPLEILPTLITFITPAMRFFPL